MGGGPWKKKKKICKGRGTWKGEENVEEVEKGRKKKPPQLINKKKNFYISKKKFMFFSYSSAPRVQIKNRVYFYE